MKKNLSMNKNETEPTLTLDDVVSFAYEEKEGVEPVLMFVHDVLPNPCLLIGRTITSVAAEIASIPNKEEGSVAFVVGKGPCAQCDVPTLFWWNSGKPSGSNDKKGDWNHSPAENADKIKAAIKNYTGPNKLNVAYHLYANADLVITEVLRGVSLSNGQIKLENGCASVVNGKNLQENGGTMWWLWLLIILLIVLVIWAVVRSRK